MYVRVGWVFGGKLEHVQLLTDVQLSRKLGRVRMAACASPSGLPASKRPRTHSKGYGASPSTSSLNNGIPVAVSGRKSFARGAIVKLRLENFL